MASNVARVGAGYTTAQPKTSRSRHPESVTLQGFFAHEGRYRNQISYDGPDGRTR